MPREGSPEHSYAMQIFIERKPWLSLPDYFMRMDQDRGDGPWLKLSWSEYPEEGEERLLANVFISTWDVLDWAMFVPAHAAQITFEAARRGGFRRRRRRPPPPGSGLAPRRFYEPAEGQDESTDDKNMVIVEVPGQPTLVVPALSTTMSIEPEDDTFRVECGLQDGRVVEFVIPTQTVLDWGLYVLTNAVQSAFEAARIVEALKLELALRFGNRPKD
jgi:hypothetical protein